MSYLIYKHTLLIGEHTGWSYIGLTKQELNKRWKYGQGYGKTQKVFMSAIQKYGWKNFKHEIIEYDIETLEKANEREKYWIAYYHTYIGDPNCVGYNMTVGGDGNPGHTLAVDSKEKIRQAHLGKAQTKETKQKISAANKNKKHGPMSNEHKLKLSAAHKGKKMSEAFKLRQSELHKGKPSGITGKKMSDATKLKMREAKLGKQFSDSHRQNLSKAKLGKKMSDATKLKMSEASTCKKAIICIETNLLFNSITDAANYYGINKSGISACLNGKRKTAGGFHWKFI